MLTDVSLTLHFSDLGSEVIVEEDTQSDVTCFLVTKALQEPVKFRICGANRFPKAKRVHYWIGWVF